MPPSKPSEQDTENDVSAKAQVINYNSDTDIAVLQIGINLTQKDNICSSSYAVYYKKTQMLNLSGNAKIQQKDDTFRAQQITLNMKTEEITLDGRVKGTVSEKEENKEVPKSEETKIDESQTNETQKEISEEKTGDNTTVEEQTAEGETEINE